MRGKKAAAAANRRDAAEVESTITSYQNAIKRLTSENVDLRKKLADAQDSKRREITRLSSELHEAVSPELRAAKKVNEELRDDLGKAKAQLADSQKKFDIVYGFAKRVLMGEGMTNLEANEAILAEFTGRKVVISEDVPNEFALRKPGGDASATEVLQRARGLRH
jgi:predicted RNase H-like nuclease (RuvC/YqgF family)